MEDFSHLVMKVSLFSKIKIVQIRNYFSKFGLVDQVEIIKRKNEKPRGFAFVYYKDEESFIRAINAVHHMDGRRVILLISKKQLDCKEALNKAKAKTRLSKERSHKIFVGGLAQKTKEGNRKKYLSLNRHTL